MITLTKGDKVTAMLVIDDEGDGVVNFDHARLDAMDPVKREKVLLAWADVLAYAHEQALAEVNALEYAEVAG